MDRADDGAGQTELRSDELAAQVGQATQSMELADPDAGASPIDRWINRVVEVIGVTVLATIVVLVFSNAAGRYAIAKPIIWADEVVIALVPWLAMCGVFLSVRRRHVIRIDFFLTRLPRIYRRAAAVLTAALSAAAFTYLAFNSFQYVALFGGDTTVYLRLPTGWFTSAMVIGATGAAIAFLADLVRDIKTQR